jgi:hypothetical protein
MDKKIRSFLKGRLSEEEASAFKKEIAEDDTLRKAVDLQRKEIAVFEYWLKEDLKNKLAQWDKEDAQEQTPEARKTQGWKTKWWLFLGLFILLTSALVFYKFKTAPVDLPKKKSKPKAPIEQSKESQPLPNNQDIKTNSITEPPQAIKNPDETKKLVTPARQKELLALAVDLHQEGVSTLDLSGRNIDQKLTQAESLFEKQLYKDVIELLQKQSIDPQQAEQYLTQQELLGHSFFMEGKYDEAAKAFQNIAAQGHEASISHPAEWNMLLSWLSDYNKNHKKIDSLLKKMLDDPHVYGPQAKELKNKLDSL